MGTACRASQGAGVITVSIVWRQHGDRSRARRLGGCWYGGGIDECQIG